MISLISIDISAQDFLKTSEKQKHWVDSVYNSMNIDEKIAQLFMLAAYSNRDSLHTNKILNLIKKYKIGGLIFFQGTPVKQAKLTNLYQSKSKTPLMISIDAEWGLRMRLDSTIKYPFQMSLGAIRNDSLIYKMGADIANQLKRLGVHVNLAPVVDINNNPRNPVINYRSFGEDKYNVSKKSYFYMKGMQDNNILTSAKHFPGHGDTDFDSHYTLPVIKHSKLRIDTLELFPYYELINKGLSGVMIAHLEIPSLDTTKNLASTLSKPIVTGLLKKKLGFKGLIFTDALNMKAVTKFYKPGDLDLKALIAGNDILLFSQNIESAIKKIKNAINNKLISEHTIKEKCKKILAAKYWLKLNRLKKIDTKNLVKDLNKPTYQLTNRKLVEASITLLRNKNNIIPLQKLDTLKIASLSIGGVKNNIFQQTLNKYTKIDSYHLLKTNSETEIENLYKKLQKYNLIIISLHDLTMSSRKSFGITKQMPEIVNNILKNKKVILSVFGNAYALNEIKGIENCNGLLLTYQENKNTKDIAAQIIFGGIAAKAKLPVKVNNFFRLNDGIETKNFMRFKYTIPEELKMNSFFVEKRIDSIANAGIIKKAFPGCQILAAKDGKIFFHKTYGYHTYDSLITVKKTDIYDFASVTKITAPLTALMRLYDEKKLLLDTTFASYWTDFKKSNKKDITVREVLAHQSQLKAWIPYWKSTVKKNGKFKWRTFKKDSSKSYPLKVINGLYLHRKYYKKIYKAIKKSELLKEKKYKYSGLSFYLYPQIISNLTGIDYENYLKNVFYKPLGAYTLTFNAYKYFDKKHVIPTEFDTFFRKKQIHAYVHDEGAAMMGGISGNAGLFGKTEDLAKLMQMFLNFGFYGNQRFISETTLKEFTKCQYPKNENRRGLGFDKPLLKNKKYGSVSINTSMNSFGHSGYTGTFVWADPKNKLLFIFMSNRVYPTRNNPKIYRLNIRPSIHQVFYDALKKGIK